MSPFDQLRVINKQHRHAYTSQSTSERALFVPHVILRFIQNTDDPAQVILTNEYFNRYAYSLSAHPHLLWRLACIGGSSEARYTKLPVTSDPNNLATAVVSASVGCSTREAQHLVAALSETELLSLAESLGWSDDQVTKLAGELSPRGKRKNHTTGSGTRTTNRR